MNDPDDPLRARFQTQRAHDQRSAPSFAAMAARARIDVANGADEKPAARLLLWLAPAAAAVVLALWLWRPFTEPAPQYSDRIAALLAEFDAPAFAQSSQPSDLLPPAFSEP